VRENREETLGFAGQLGRSEKTQSMMCFLQAMAHLVRCCTYLIFLPWFTK